MTKEEAARALTEAGYPAAVEDGVIMIRNPVRKSERRKIAKEMKEMKYESSYGWRVRP